MSDQHAKAGAPFWTTVVLVASLFGYLVSFGPACWITSRANSGTREIPIAYRPMTWAMSQAGSFADALSWYAELGAAPAWRWVDLSWFARSDPGAPSEWIWTADVVF